MSDFQKFFAANSWKPIKSVEFANPSNVVRLKPRVRIVTKQQPETAA